METLTPSTFSGEPEFETRRIDPLQGDEWDTLVAGHPGAGFFHRSAWARVLAATYGHKPFYTALFVSGKPAVLAPVMEVNSLLTGRRGVSLPFTDYCDLLISEGFESVPILPFLSNLAKAGRWRHLELRGAPVRPFPGAPPAASYRTHRLDLRKGLPALESALHPSHRRSLKKAAAAGLRMDTRTDEEAVEVFYALHTRTRKKHGLPPQPRAFFRHIFREVIRLGLGFVVLAFHEEKPLAGAVFFHSGKEAVYKFGASRSRENTLRENHAVMWHGIRHLAENGFKSLHFGRTSLEQEGLARYKMNWGATESIVDYFRLDPRRMEWKTSARGGESGGHTILFSRFPLALNRLLGTFIYPHLD